MPAPQLTLGCSLPGGAGLVEAAALAEELGFDRLSIGEHVMDGNPPRPSVMALPAIAAAAGATRRVRLLTGIVIAPLYHPVLLAKLVATVDEVSNGRLDFGIGLSGQRATRIEYDIQGIPVETRGRRANEMLAVMKRLWTEEHVTHEGEFFSFKDATLLPKPVQKPYPPIWVAGRSTAAARRAATMGDGWYPYLFTVPRLKASNDSVRQMAEAAGRDMTKFRFAVLQPTVIADDPLAALAVAAKGLGPRYATAERSAEDIARSLAMTGSARECVKGIEDRVAAGVRDFIFAFQGDERSTGEQMRLMAKKVLPTFR